MLKNLSVIPIPNLLMFMFSMIFHGRRDMHLIVGNKTIPTSSLLHKNINTKSTRMTKEASKNLRFL